MSFIEYANNDNSLEKEEGVNSSSSSTIDLSKIKNAIIKQNGKTANVDIKINSDDINTEVSYNFRSIIPDIATITRKDIIVYGFIDGFKQLVSTNNNLIRVISIDNKYKDIFMSINIEYTYNNSYYVINDLITLDNSKTTKLSISIDNTSNDSSFDDVESLLSYLLNSNRMLLSRIEDLEANII